MDHLRKFSLALLEADNSVTLEVKLAGISVVSQFDNIHIETSERMDLSRYSAAPSARLGHLALEGDRAFPAQC